MAQASQPQIQENDVSPELEVVHGQDDEGLWHDLYPVGVNYAFRPTAFCGVVLTADPLVAEIPDGGKRHKGCKPTAEEKAEQKEAVTAAENPEPPVS